MKNNLISIIAIVISVIAIGFSLLRIFPFEITSDTYIGTIATFIGIAVTMLIGYQIVNTLEIKKEVAEQRKLANDLKQMNNDLNKIIENQKKEMQEGFDILFTLVRYQENGWTSSIQAFCSLHAALVTSLGTDRTEYEWIFKLLRKYIADINRRNFTYALTTLSDGRFICDSIDGKYHQKELKDIIKEYTDVVDKDEKQIREDSNFCRIQIEYDRVMRLFRKRIDKIIKDPNKDITPEEEFAITNPQ